jgi:hypothetical protein
VVNQYLDKKRDDPHWFFKEFLAALTDDELWGCVSWQLLQRRCKECRTHPCEEPCADRKAAEHRLVLCDDEMHRRGTWRGQLQHNPRRRR